MKAKRSARYTSIMICTVLGTGLTMTSAAAIASPTKLGKVTVDGKSTDPEVFEGFALHFLTRAQRCPPASDPYVRDKVVAWYLFENEGRRLKAKPDKRAIENVMEYEKELAEMPKNSRQSDFAKTRKALAMFYRHSAYINPVFAASGFPGSGSKVRFKVVERLYKQADIRVDGQPVKFSLQPKKNWSTQEPVCE